MSNYLNEEEFLKNYDIVDEESDLEMFGTKPLFIYHYLYDCEIPKKEYVTVVDIKNRGENWTVAQFINSDNSDLEISDLIIKNSIKLSRSRMEHQLFD